MRLFCGGDVYHSINFSLHVRKAAVILKRYIPFESELILMRSALPLKLPTSLPASVKAPMETISSGETACRNA